MTIGCLSLPTIFSQINVGAATQWHTKHVGLEATAQICYLSGN